MIYITKRNTLIFLYALLLIPVQGISQDLIDELPESFQVKVINPIDVGRENVLIILKPEEIKKLHSSFNDRAFVVMDDAKEIQSQYNQNGPNKGLTFLLDEVGAKESKVITIRYKNEGQFKRAYPKRTQAELSHKAGGKFENRKYIGGEFQNIDSLRVPDEHTDHSYYLRYEGPGWESDKVGYRYYLDWRNAVDVFGKKTDEVALQKIGLDGFDSYHGMQEWGMDVMKVGKALGVGSMAYFHDQKAIRVDKTDSVIAIIRENGNIYSEIETQYYGWQVANQKFDLVSHLGIHAGSRLTHHLVEIENGNPDHLSTGLGKDKSSQVFIEKGSKNSWGYMASYGKQSLNSDELGIAILFPSKDLVKFTEDDLSHVVQIKPKKNKVEYYFLAAWVLEPGGIQNEKEFLEYMKKTARELANPVRVEIMKAKTQAQLRGK